MDGLKKLRCKKALGTFYYRKVESNDYDTLDAPIYELYDADKKKVADFAYYGDMKYYLETGIIL